MIPFDEPIFQMGWFNHQLDNTNPFFSRILHPWKFTWNLKNHLLEKEYHLLNLHFWGVQNVNFSKVYHFHLKIEDLNMSPGCLWSGPKHSPRTVALAWLTNSYGFVGCFFPEVEKIMSDLHFSKVFSKNPLKKNSPPVAHQRDPVGMADFCCPAVELLKWSSQPDCSGTQHWVWLEKRACRFAKL